MNLRDLKFCPVLSSNTSYHRSATGIPGYVGQCTLIFEKNTIFPQIKQISLECLRNFSFPVGEKEEAADISDYFPV